MVKYVKRAMALLLAVSLCMSLLSVATGATAAENTCQIQMEGGMAQEDQVSIRKTIRPTEIENYFDIDLEVVTHEQLTRVSVEQDAAVVLVMDISNTMTSKIGAEPATGSDTRPTRYQAAITAAEHFLQQFAAQSSGAQPGVRQIGYVAFNTDAHEIFPMSEYNADDLIDTMKRKTEAIIYDADYGLSTQRFTNIEAGLKLAGEMLNQVEGIQNKYVIFLSDGFPTTYVRQGVQGYSPYTDSGTPGTDGVFYNQRTRKYCSSGTSYSDKAATRAEQQAQALKDSGIKIFTIGVDIAGQTIAEYEEQDQGLESISVIDCDPASSGAYVIERDGTFLDWLKNKIGSGYYGDNQNTSSLEGVYDEIFKTITEDMESGSVNDLYVTDPMAEHIEFLGLYQKDGTLSPALTGSKEEHAENTAAFDREQETIRWNLLRSGYTKQVETHGQVTTTRYTYRLSYRVRLRNEDSDFLPRQAYQTNETTSVFYELPGEEKPRSLDAPLPEVEGYLGQLKFTKKSTRQTPLAGAQFTLSHSSTCRTCGLAGQMVALAAQTAVSDQGGIVQFDGIPSGHDYTLLETGVPVGYVENSQPSLLVEVQYGTVRINGKAANRTVIYNQPMTDTMDTYQPRAVKLLDGQIPAKGAFTFSLTSEDGSYTDLQQNDENGLVLFDALSYREAGTYVYFIQEIETTQEAIQFDPSVYRLCVVVKKEVTPSSSGGAYAVNPDTVYSLGGDTVYGINSDAVEIYPTSVNYRVREVEITRIVDEQEEVCAGILFENTTRAPEPVSLSLCAQKQLDGSAPADGRFRFQLHQAGELLEEQTNQGEWVTFSPRSYSLPGSYLYTISEVAGDEETILYDPARYDVTVEVREKEHRLMAELTQVRRYSAADPEGVLLEDQPILFQNTTKVVPPPEEETPPEETPPEEETPPSPGGGSERPASARWQLTATKTLDGTPAAGFQFRMTGEGVDVTVTSDTEGRILFPVQTYRKSGTYTYQLTELSGEGTQVRYDPSVYTAQVTVIRRGDYKIEGVVLQKDGESVENVVFQNQTIPTEEPPSPSQPPESPMPSPSVEPQPSELPVEPPQPIEEAHPSALPVEQPAAEPEPTTLPVPLVTPPKTGDTTGAWLTLSALSALGLSVLHVTERKKRT